MHPALRLRTGIYSRYSRTRHNSSPLRSSGIAYEKRPFGGISRQSEDLLLGRASFCDWISNDIAEDLVVLGFSSRFLFVTPDLEGEEVDQGNDEDDCCKYRDHQPGNRGHVELGRHFDLGY